MTHYFLKRTFGIFRMQIQWLVVLTLLTLLHTGLVAAQNLVPNPSFELKTSCPTEASFYQIQGVTLWTSPTTASPDYYHTCATGPSGVGVPSNGLGNQTPNTGQAYAGFILRPINEYREYLEIPLTVPLMAGMKYKVSFYVSLADASQWAVDKVGAYFSVGSVGPIATAYPLNVVPQVVNPTGSYITSKTIWTQVSGNYLAVGGETHMVIGNFANNASTTPLTGLGGFYPGSYYYIDDVSVTGGRCDLAIDKSLSSGSALTNGQPATFQITVTNKGTGLCSGPITVKDPIPAGLTYPSGSPSLSLWNCSVSSGVLQCTNPSPLLPGQSVPLLATYTVTAPSKKIVNNCATTQHVNDLNPANNQACIALTVGKTTK